MNNRIRKQMRKRAALLIAALLLAAFSGFFLLPQKAHAETKTADITELSSDGKLAVSFEFDTREVPVTLISPDGKRYSEGTEGLKVYRGDLWALYEIENAKAGIWQAEYDKGSNSQIVYHIMDSEGGIAIQSFAVSNVTGSDADVSFLVDRPGEAISYSYTVTASNSRIDGIPEDVVLSGSATSGETVSEQADLSGFSSGEDCVLTLSIEGYGNNGNLEFDTMESDSFSYTNENAPEALGDFTVRLEQTICYAEVDWSEEADGWTILLSVVADGKTDNTVYTGVLDDGESFNSFYYPDGTKELSISVSYLDGNVFSAPKTKVIDLENGEYLKTGRETVTQSGQMPITFKVNEPRELSVDISGKVQKYRLSGESQINLSLTESDNAVYAYFEGDDKIVHIIDTEMEYSGASPEIIVYDDPDGMAFDSDKITLAGRIRYASSATLDGEDLAIDENGEFKTTLTLNKGENVFVLQALSSAGTAAEKTMTVYGGTGKPLPSGNTSDDTGTLSGMLRKALKDRGLPVFLPLFAALALSIIIIVIAIIRIKKRPKKGHRGSIILIFVLLDILFALGGGTAFYLYRLYDRRAGSMEFLSMMEESFESAEKFIETKQMFGKAALICTILFAACLIFTVAVVLIAGRIKKRKNSAK